MYLDQYYQPASGNLFFLVGFMGTGKTHWGRIWAREAGFSFVDLDEFIEHEEGDSVKEIFEKKGESYFRQCEAAALRQLLQSSHTVIACGGGTPCFFDNMKLMNQHGTTVWMRAAPHYILQNVQRQAGKRPLIKGKNEEEMLDFIKTKLVEREPFYSQAKFIFSADATKEGSLASLGFLKR